MLTFSNAQRVGWRLVLSFLAIYFCSLASFAETPPAEVHKMAQLGPAATLEGPVDSSKRPQESVHPLVGLWQVAYTPNRAVRLYDVDARGGVQLLETGWLGKLVACPAGDGGWTIQFPDAPGPQQERWTLCGDGRLLVEHFNPGGGLESGSPPDQVGIAKRVLPTPTKLAAPSPEGAPIPAEEFVSLLGQVRRGERSPDSLLGKQVEFDARVGIARSQPLVEIEHPSLQGGSGWNLFHLFRIAGDNEIPAGKRLKVVGRLVEHGYAAWFVWVDRLEWLPDVPSREGVGATTALDSAGSE